MKITSELQKFWTEKGIYLPPQNFEMQQKPLSPEIPFPQILETVGKYPRGVEMIIEFSPPKKIPEEKILAAIAKKGFLKKENPVVQFFLELWKNEICTFAEYQNTKNRKIVQNLLSQFFPGKFNLNKTVSDLQTLFSATEKIAENFS